MASVRFAARVGLVATTLSLCLAAPSQADPNSDLAGAAYAGDVGAVADALRRGGQVNGWVNGQPPLIWATQRGHREAVRLLLRAGASVAAADQRGFTALMWAAQLGHLDVARELLAAGADPRARTAAGSAAEVARASSNTAMMQLMAGGGLSPAPARRARGAAMPTFEEPVDLGGYPAWSLGGQLPMPAPGAVPNNTVQQLLAGVPLERHPGAVVRCAVNQTFAVQAVFGTGGVGDTSFETVPAPSTPPADVRGYSGFTIGIRPEYTLSRTARTRLFLGAELAMTRLSGPAITGFSDPLTFAEYAVTPMLGVEYMLTDRLSIDAAFGNTSTWSTIRRGNADPKVSVEARRFELLNTWAMPMFGFHYYLGPVPGSSSDEP